VRSVFTSFLANNIELSDVGISGDMTEEMMVYLSLFSGLKRLFVAPNSIPWNFENMLFAEILPNHVDSLQSLEIRKVSDHG
jgi:hypothetical protein